MFKFTPKPYDYTKEQIDAIMAQGYQWRQSTKWPKVNGVGIWWRHVTQNCPHHGEQKHIEVLAESGMQRKYAAPLCKACCEDVKKDREKQAERQPKYSCYTPPSTDVNRF